jgi:hypothetical protein
MDADGVHEDIVEMDVGVYAAGEDEEVAGIYGLVGVEIGEVTNGSYLFTSYQYVLLGDSLADNGRSAANEGCFHNL